MRFWPTRAIGSGIAHRDGVVSAFDAISPVVY